MTKIKLCGNFRLIDMEYINSVQPDMAGVILAPGYRRSINFDLAKQMRKKLDATIPLVGVFVNQDNEQIIPYLEENIIQVIQLHGQESEAQIKALQQFNRPIINVLRPEQIGQKTIATYTMYDTSGGSGNSFDWHKLQGIKSEQPFFLAGGLNKVNLTTAITTANPDFVDISSGSEINGVKNLATMQCLVSLARVKGENNGSKKN